MQMEGEDDKLEETYSSEVSSRTRVGFPRVREEKKGKGKIIFILLAILALGAVGVWLIFGKGGWEKTTEIPTPTVTDEVVSPTPVPVEIERDGISIQILNGSGISGAAGDLENEMEDLGYTDITVGNASKQDYEDTEVSFSEEIPNEVREEITDKLKAVYESVIVASESVEDYDVKIVTGLPKGYTPSPTKAAATSTPTPVEEETVTPTATLTPTP